MSAEEVQLEADPKHHARESFIAGYQVCSLVAPPAYLAFRLSRHGRNAPSINRFLCITWLAGVGGGATYGGLSYYWCKTYKQEHLKSKRLQGSFNDIRLRADDYSTIGAFLMAILTPALLWKKANAINLVLGGAGLGSSLGLATHYSQSLKTLAVSK